MLDQFLLTDRVAIVTGGNRGLGRAMAIALASAGARVIIAARDLQAAEAVRAEIIAQGGDAECQSLDVGDDAAAEALVNEVAARYGRLDILINNAGIVGRKPLAETTPEDYRAVIDINLNSAFVLSRAAAPHMRKNRYGRIINIGSIMSRISRAGVPGYVSSKHGIDGLTKALAAELGPDGITVNGIGPGYFVTDITTPLQATDFKQMVEQRTPLGRWGQPEDLSGATVFLASPAASYVNGHLMIIDGGLSTTL